MAVSPPLDAPILVLGAARSGTKALRATLSSHPSLSMVPHDINFVWKYGNYEVPHDALCDDLLTPRIRRFIRRHLARYQTPERPRVVEKTVSNTLRVEFVKAVVPEGRFVHLIRDGRDVAASALRMWQSPPEWRRLLTKLQSFPLAAVPRYGLSYLTSYLDGRLRQGQGTRSWGPRFPGIDDLVRRLTLLEVCAIQWRESIESVRRSLSHLGPEEAIEVRYEDLVHEPHREVSRILAFFGLGMTPEVEQHVAAHLTASSVGKWRRQIDREQLPLLLRHLGGTLRELGYDTEEELQPCPVSTAS